MTCRDTKTLLALEGSGSIPPSEQPALDRHLAACDRCAEVAKVARLSVVLLGALREEVEPGPTFYPRLRTRMAAERTGEPEATFLQTWRFARRLIPALALGVLLLAGVTIPLSGSPSSQQSRAGHGGALYALSLEEVNAPGTAVWPNQDQMLAFVLTRDNESDSRDTR